MDREETLPDSNSNFLYDHKAYLQRAKTGVIVENQ